MKRYLKIVAIVTSFVVMLSAFAGCTQNGGDGSSSGSADASVSSENANDELSDAQAEDDDKGVIVKPEHEDEPDRTINIAMLKGPTGIGAAKLMKLTEEGDVRGDYNFSLLSSPDDAMAQIISGEVDVAAIPTNLAAAIYNKTGGEIRAAAVNTLGVLYILENGSTINSLADLSGKTVYATGQGAVPEYALQYVLDANNVKDVKIEYMQEHAQLAAAMVSGEVKIAMLPEPNVTAVLMKNPDVRIAVDLNEQWNLTGNGDLVMGCLVGRKDFIEKHEKQFNKLLDEYDYSISCVSREPEEVAKLVAEYGILPSEEMALKALDNCNVTFLRDEDMGNALYDFYEVLYAANPKSIGGAMPEDDFYYIRSYR